MVAHSQTVEDGAPRVLPEWTLHHEGTAREYLRIEMAVRQAVVEPARLVIRASRDTLIVTAALQQLRVE